MSLDISLINVETDEEEYDMNWLRNQYGLIYWAMDNVGDKVNIPKGKDLWYIVNHWNYKKSNRVNRELFKRVVDEYWKYIEPLEEGFFAFSLTSFIQFIAPNFSKLPKNKWGNIDGIKYNEGRTKVMLPMEHFKHPSFHLRPIPADKTMLQEWKDWFKQLVEFAEMLQDRKYRYYCSN
jgi:hypothetical protein